MCARGVEERNTMRTSGESEAETERPHINKKSHQLQILHVVGFDLHQVQVLTFCGLFLDSIDYIADAVLGSPRWSDKGRKKANEVGYFLFSLNNSFFVFTYFVCFELKRVAKVVVCFTAYLCACRNL